MVRTSVLSNSDHCVLIAILKLIEFLSNCYWNCVSSCRSTWSKRRTWSSMRTCCYRHWALMWQLTIHIHMSYAAVIWLEVSVLLSLRQEEVSAGSRGTCVKATWKSASDCSCCGHSSCGIWYQNFLYVSCCCHMQTLMCGTKNYCTPLSSFLYVSNHQDNHGW